MEDLIFSIIEKEPKTFKEIKKILNKKGFDIKPKDLDSELRNL